MKSLLKAQDIIKRLFFLQLHRTIQTLAEKDDKANSACKDIEERKANYELLNRELTNEKVSAFNYCFFVGIIN